MTLFKIACDSTVEGLAAPAQSTALMRFAKGVTPFARRGYLVLFLLLAANPALPTPLDGMVSGGHGQVARVLSGDTLAFGDGRTVRLAEVRAPRDRRGDPLRRYAGRSREALQRLSENQLVTLRYGGARMDRYGRVLAHLVREDGVWLQQSLVSEGLALVWPAVDNRAAAAALLAAEEGARSARRGFWRDPGLLVRDAGSVDRGHGSIRIVEGRVLDAAEVGRRAFLNFGPDWRTDFTVRIESQALRLFKAAEINPLHYQDRRIRVRGVLARRDGPQIEVTHPERIEVLSLPLDP